MTPDDFDRERQAMQALHRAASDAFDERPSARVRIAVLDEARRGAEAHRARGLGRQWPRSLAAVLVVSVMTGLVATQVMRDDPARLATIGERADAIDRAVDATPGVASTEPESAPAQIATPARPPVAQARKPVAATESGTRAKTAIAARSDVAVAEPAPPPSPTEPVPAVAAPQAVADAPKSDAAPVAESTTRRLALAAGESMRRVAPETPEAWVERIVQLRTAGRDDEADREVAMLRARYPDFTVPATAARTGTR